MKKFLLPSLLLFGLYANAQVDVTATAGTTTANYTTLKSAFDAINTGTHQGDIKLSISGNTTETATAVLNAVTTYTSLLIKPTSTVSITGAITGLPLVTILGSNVTIDGSMTATGTTRDLTFSNTATTFSSVLHMGAPASVVTLRNVTVKNAIFSNGSLSSSNFVISYGGSETYFKNVTVQNNDIRTGLNGIVILASTSVSDNGNNLIVTDNTINTSIVQNGIVVNGVGGVSTISNNTIATSNATIGSSTNGQTSTGVVSDTSASGSVGISLGAGTNNASVFGNTISAKHTAANGINYATGIAISAGAQNVSTKVYNNTITEVSGFLSYLNSSGIFLGEATPNVSIYNNKISRLKNNHTVNPIQGILLGSSSASANTIIYNNIISDVLGNGGQVFGIYAFSGAGYKIYNNTLNLNTSNAEPGISAALMVYGTNIKAANALDVRNNILANLKASGSRYAIYSSAASTVFSNLDYNNYSSTGAALGFSGGANKVTLADIQSGFGSNVNSLAITPAFVSPINSQLHPNTNEGLDNKGISLPEVPTDFNGITRSATPDMGAYEFTYVAPVLAPTCTTITTPINGATGVSQKPTSITWDTVSGATSYKVYIGTTSGGTDIANGTSTTITSYNAVLSGNTLYYVKVVPYNSAGDASGCPEISFTTGDPSYCIATSDNATYYNIGNVIISDNSDNTVILSNSGTGTAGYENFTAIPINVNQEKSYFIQLSVRFGYIYNAVYAWIDFNRDGILDDVTEKTNLTYTYSGSQYSLSIATGTIAIPNTAKLGSTRLRIRLDETRTIRPNATSCGSSYNGQVEDYTLNIQGPSMAISEINKTTISVYPNPFTDVLKISDVKGVKSVSVNDISGREVKSLAPSAELNLSNLKAGLYIVNLKMEDGSVKTFKAIKK